MCRAAWANGTCVTLIPQSYFFRVCDAVHTSSAQSALIIKSSHCCTLGGRPKMDAQPRNQLSPAKISDRLFVRQLGYTRSLVTFLIRRQALPENRLTSLQIWRHLEECAIHLVEEPRQKRNGANFMPSHMD